MSYYVLSEKDRKIYGSDSHWIKSKSDDWIKLITGCTLTIPDYTNKESNKVEFLYQIYIVEKNRTVDALFPVVAKNEEEAKHQAGVYTHHAVSGKRLSEVNIIVQNLGSVVVND